MNQLIPAQWHPRFTGIFVLLAGGMVAWSLMWPAWAATPSGSGIDWLRMGMGLFGGLSLFLFGMEQMSSGLKSAAGPSLRTVLAGLTRNRFMGALTGAFVTAVLNSSSVTTVLVVGFITAGVMTLSQSIGVIMGANIGSTITAQIIAFNVTQYALALVTVGFMMLFVGEKDSTRNYGSMIMGLGLVFFGMGVMSESMTPLRSYQPFLDLMIRMEQPLLGILVGAVFTGLVQSSAATTGIAIVMATEGLISLPAGIALAFGSNIGTCVTALLAALGKPTEAVRAAVAHILFNVAGVVIWVAFIPQLAEFVMAISPSRPDLEGADRMTAEVPRQIANAHTVFNVLNTVLFIGFTGWFARLVERLVPEKPVEEKIIVSPKFLDDGYLETPSLALDRVRLELGHLGEIVHHMYATLPEALTSGHREPLEELRKMDDKVDVLEGEVIAYLGKVRKQTLSDEESDEFVTLMNATDYLESIGDVIESDLVPLGLSTLDQEIQVSETMEEMLHGLHATVGKAVDAAVHAVSENDEVAAQEVISLKDEVNHRIDEALRHQAGRLDQNEQKRLQIFRAEMAVVDKLKRIYTLSKRMAKGVLPRGLMGRSE